VVEHIRAKFDDKVQMRLVFRTRDDHDISDLDGGARDIEVSHSTSPACRVHLTTTPPNTLLPPPLASSGVARVYVRRVCVYVLPREVTYIRGSERACRR
jgi:hypothetical protein